MPSTPILVGAFALRSRVARPAVAREGASVPRELIPRLAKLNADGLFPFDELITMFPLSQINEAEAKCKSGEVVKPVLTFEGLT